MLYSIYIDNDGDALPDVTYQFSFNTHSNPNTFLYNTGRSPHLSTNWNKRQFYSVARLRGDRRSRL